MAKENVKAFYEALSKEETMQQMLKEKELAYTGKKEDREAVISEVLIPVAEEAGYAFTLDELKEFEKGMRPEGELDEGELETIAGGVDYSGGIRNWGFCFLLGIAGGKDCIAGGTGLCFIAGV